MTTKNKDKKLKRVNLRLWEADLAYLQRIYPDNYNAQIRRIICNWVVNQPVCERPPVEK